MSESSEDEKQMPASTKRVHPPAARKRGTREDVWAGYAERTNGNLTKDDLIQTPSGKIVSKKASEKSRQLMLERNSKQKPPLLKKDEPEVSQNVEENHPPKPSVKPKAKQVQKVETPSKSTVVIHTQQKKKTQKPKK
jgi:hypothetical protein